MDDHSHPRALADEHALLRQEISDRQERVLDALAAGRWPAAEVDALLGYLRYEVLDQAVNEERWLFPHATEGFGNPQIQQLVAEHVQLRDVADELAATSQGTDQDPGRLATALDDLWDRLDRHLRNEEEILAPVTTTGIESLRHPFRAHEWFPLTEGPVLDVDVLPGGFAHRAALDRLTRMRPGEHLQVRSRNGNGLDSLWRVIERHLPGDYAWAYLEEGPDQWHAEIIRRQSD